MNVFPEERGSLSRYRKSPSTERSHGRKGGMKGNAALHRRKVLRPRTTGKAASVEENRRFPFRSDGSAGFFQERDQLDQRHSQTVGQFFHGGKRGGGRIATFQFLKILIIHPCSLSQVLLSQSFGLSQAFQCLGETKVNGFH